MISTYPQTCPPPRLRPHTPAAACSVTLSHPEFPAPPPEQNLSSYAPSYVYILYIYIYIVQALCTSVLLISNPIGLDAAVTRDLNNSQKTMIKNITTSQFQTTGNVGRRRILSTTWQSLVWMTRASGMIFSLVNSRQRVSALALPTVSLFIMFIMSTNRT
jgi:hypothetical protein